MKLFNLYVGVMPPAALNMPAVRLLMNKPYPAETVAAAILWS